MSAFIFTKAILAGQPIKVFNRGDMRRDFTYIDDITVGVLAALDRPPPCPPPHGGGGLGGGAPHRLYNLGNNRSEELLDFIATIEAALGRKAIIELAPMQPGDVTDTYADIAASRRELGFAPKTSIREGVPKFIAWYRAFYRV
jgi:UDP-glucuronate 4-epimerase